MRSKEEIEAEVEKLENRRAITMIMGNELSITALECQLAALLWVLDKDSE